MVSAVSSSEFIAIGLVIVLSLVGSVVAQIVFQRLELHHHEEWERLGRPNLIRVSSGNSFELIRFVWSLRFIQLRDRTLNVLVTLSILISAGIVGQLCLIAFWF